MLTITIPPVVPMGTVQQSKPLEKQVNLKVYYRDELNGKSEPRKVLNKAPRRKRFDSCKLEPTVDQCKMCTVCRIAVVYTWLNKHLLTGVFHFI